MKVKKTYCIVEASSRCGSHYDCWKEITGGLKAKGWNSSSSPKKSGIILLRECCMTTQEIDQAIKDLAKLAKMNLHSEIFLGECLSRTKAFVEAARKTMPWLNLHTFTTPQEFFQELEETYEQPKEPILSIAIDNAAIINIAKGCNRKCSFCKVAYMDFPLECEPLETILQKIEMAKEKGTHKIVLNAMNSTQYNDKGRHFQDLLEAVLEIPDMYYQVNGMVMAELTPRALELLQNPRFFSLQLEVQSLIPEVRKYMNIGEISTEHILHIFEQLRGKNLFSNLIVGGYRERDKDFQEQLDLIYRNNLFFLCVIDLVPTPGTPSASMNNPPSSKVQSRMLEVLRLQNKMRSKVAKEMLGKEQSCMVISENSNGGSMLLAENGVLVHTKGHLPMGQILSVVPKQIKGLFCGQNQLMILSTEETSSHEEFDEEMMWNLFCTMKQEAIGSRGDAEGFNRNDLSLKAYCEKKFIEEMNQKETK